MTTHEAVALYRAEQRAAFGRGTDLVTPQPIPEKHHRRVGVALSEGFATVSGWRHDAFVVSRK